MIKIFCNSKADNEDVISVPCGSFILILCIRSSNTTYIICFHSDIKDTDDVRTISLFSTKRRKTKFNFLHEKSNSYKKS